MPYAIFQHDGSGGIGGPTGMMLGQTTNRTPRHLTAQASTSPGCESCRVVTRVLCVDDSPDITKVVQVVIDADPTMKCVGSLSSADDLLEVVRCTGSRPDVVVLDGIMPGNDSWEAVRQLGVEFRVVNGVLHNGFEDPDYTKSAADADVWGFVSKD